VPGVPSGPHDGSENTSQFHDPEALIITYSPIVILRPVSVQSGFEVTTTVDWTAEARAFGRNTPNIDKDKMPMIMTVSVFFIFLSPFSLSFENLNQAF
jgi:hypothetical protein